MSHAVETPTAGKGIMHTVIVGGDAGLVYTPSEVFASIGDTIHFVFMKNNHTVTQSTFEKPCNKKSADAHDSGFLANANNTVVPAPTFEYTVISMDPTWWYCKQRTGTHCGKGMVFAINPTIEKTLNTFRDVAIQLNGTVTATTVPVAATTAPATAAAPTASTTHTGAIVIGTPMPKVGGSCQCHCLCAPGSFNSGGMNYGAAINPPTLPSASAVPTLITSTKTGWVSAIAPTPVLETPVSAPTEVTPTPAITWSVSEAGTAYTEVMSVEVPSVTFVGTLTEGATWAGSTSTAVSAESALDAALLTKVESTAILPIETLILDTIPYATFESSTTAPTGTEPAATTAAASTETPALDSASSSSSSSMAEPTASAEIPVLDTTPSPTAISTVATSAESLVVETASPTTAESVTAEYTTSAETSATPTTESSTSTPIFASSVILTAPVATANDSAEATSIPAEAAEPINDVAAEITGVAKFVNFNTIDLSGLKSAWTGGI